MILMHTQEKVRATCSTLHALYKRTRWVFSSDLLGSNPRRAQINKSSAAVQSSLAIATVQGFREYFILEKTHIKGDALCCL